MGQGESALLWSPALTCRGSGCNRGEAVPSHCPPVCPHPVECVVKWDRRGGGLVRQNIPWPVAVGSSMFPASGTACGSCRGSVLWVRCRTGTRWCRPHAMLVGLWGDLRDSLCHSTAPWAMLQVLEEKPSGLLVASLQAKDPDEGENGTIIYSLIGTSSRTGTSVPLCLAAHSQMGAHCQGSPHHTPPLSHPPLCSLCHSSPSRVSLCLQEPGQSVSRCMWLQGSCGQPRFCAAPTAPSTSSP